MPGASGMGDWEKAIYAIIVFALTFFMIRHLKKNPEKLSKANFLRGSQTMLWLTVGLIGFVGLLVMLLRQ